MKKLLLVVNNQNRDNQKLRAFVVGKIMPSLPAKQNEVFLEETPNGDLQILSKNRDLLVMISGFISGYEKATPPDNYPAFMPFTTAMEATIFDRLW